MGYGDHAGLRVETPYDAARCRRGSVTHVAVTVDHNDVAATSPQLEPNRATYDTATNDTDFHIVMTPLSVFDCNRFHTAKPIVRICNSYHPE
jgi:hypothetical protein